MLGVRPRVAAAGALALALSAGYLAQGTYAAGGTPANKAVAAGSKRVVTGPGVKVKLMSATFKTSKPTDLLIQISAECSILTDVVIPGSDEPGATQTAEASASVRVWAELDGKIVPLNDISSPPQDPADSAKGTDSDKATFCDRLHRRTVSDREDPQDGVDGSRDYMLTKSANAFNWVRMNAGSGLHELVVYADLAVGTLTAGSNAQAHIGNRTLIVEPTKMANAAVIAENGTSTSGS